MILDIPTARVFKPLLAPARYKGAYGGRGSGKSHFFAETAIDRCLADGCRIVCIREVQNSLKDSVRQLLVDKIEALGVRDQFDITREEIRGHNGSLIIFRGMNDANAENIKSLEGFDVAWVEEAHTLSQRSLEMLRPTIRKPKSELWFSWNPTSKTDPVDKFLRENPPVDAIVVKANHLDNPWFPRELFGEMELDRAKDPAKASHIWDGAYDVAPAGNYYGAEMAECEANSRIIQLMPDPALSVHTAWDLGVGGNMRFWAFQADVGGFRWLYHHKFEHPGLPHAASILDGLKAKHKWRFGKHLWPHDGSSKDIGSGERRCDMMEKLGYRVEVLPRGDIGDGIEAVRRVLKMSYFDRDGTVEGVAALKAYRRKFDKSRHVFVEEPDHDDSSHTADAFRTAAMGQHLLTNDAPATAAAWAKVDKWEFIAA